MIGARLRSLLTPGVRPVGDADRPRPTCAEWHGTVLAESDEVRTASGYLYFPPGSVRWEHLEPSDHQSVCGWKGVASYYDVVVDGDRNPNAAWTYSEPLPAVEELAGWVAFWGGVKARACD